MSILQDVSPLQGLANHPRAESGWLTGVVVTGHRPPQLGGYSSAARWRLEDFAFQTLSSWLDKNSSPVVVVTGMAQGWDQACASACRNLGVPYVAVIPHESMGSKWPEDACHRFRSLMIGAAKKIISPDRMDKRAWVERDHAMVDLVSECENSQCIALYGGGSGGTKHTMDYAERKGVPILNAWDKWQEQNP